jgi:hypothetical protein
MRKRQKDLQELESDAFGKTYGDLQVRFVDYEKKQPDKKGDQPKYVIKSQPSFDTLDMARLRDPAKYPYVHKPRLYRSATDVAVKCLATASSIVEKVPASYRTEIFLSGGYGRLWDEILRGPEAHSDKGDELNRLAFNYYSQMLINGLQGITAMMPEQFNALLLQDLQPFLTTMFSISSFAKAVDPKSKIPTLTIPLDLLPSLRPRSS